MERVATEFAQIVSIARSAFGRGITKDLSFRTQQLKNFYRMLKENEDRFVSSVMQDLSKPEQESVLYEVEFSLNDLRCMLQNLEKWSKREDSERNMITLLDQTYIIREPFGVVLVIGAWNYPVQLSFAPMIGAIAAGNCVILKPSEMSPRTADLMKEMIPKYLDTACYHVVTGGPQETTELLKLQFDYIFYTGSTGIGKIVREASNKYLTPTTLELGGKSPVFLDDSVDLSIACRRLLWGKFINAGQTCVAPDYLLCTASTRQKLIPVIKDTLIHFYSDIPQKSADLGRVISAKHFNRLVSLMKAGEIVIGGETDETTNYIAPTVIINVGVNDPIMQEEIFGPLFPIITVNSVDEAIDIINSKEKPLTMNIYSKRNDVIQKILNNTSSGSVCVNDSIVNLSIDALPFGGVGASGMGSYHGKYSFDTFSHKKAVLVRNYSMLGEKLGSSRYPPYSKEKTKFLQKLLKKRADLPNLHLDYFLLFTLGIVTAFAIQAILHAQNIKFL